LILLARGFSGRAYVFDGSIVCGFLFCFVMRAWWVARGRRLCI
jgi:hypothetical protein